MTYLAPYLSPLGPITLASDGESLTGLWFDGQKYDRASLHGAIAVDAPLPEVLVEACHWLDLYFAGEVPDFVPKLRVEGSPFRQSVAEVMLTIPYGGTMTYGEIGRLLAARMGRPSMSAQAVGGAVGHNPISLIIPCHRVVGSTGSLTGYAGGLDRKAWLLRHEAEHAELAVGDIFASLCK